MGMARIFLTVASATTIVEATRVSEKGILQGIGISLVPSLVQMGRLWVEVGARLGGDVDELINVIFLSGPSWYKRALFWTGAFKLEPFTQLYAKALSTVSIRVIANFSIDIGDP